MAIGDGYMVGWGDTGRLECDTVQCVHCGGHYQVQPGSGKRRGFCLRCAGATCGSASCMTCEPVEKKLARQEQYDQMFHVERARIAERYAQTILDAVQRDLALKAQALTEARLLTTLWGAS